MGVTSPTIKALYAKSGNKCAFPGCNKTLMEDINNSNICHIISEKPNGPRHDPNFIDYDAEDNLILLCRNHHNEVDTNVQYYSVDVLHMMKEKHEQLIIDLVENNGEFNDLKIKLLKNIDSFDIIDIIQNEDYSAPFNCYKLMNISNFIDAINAEILTTYNINFTNSKFISNITDLNNYFEELRMYLLNNTEVSDDGRVIKIKKGKTLNSQYIHGLRVKIANEIKKYI